eukprot:TRINITY_DN39541_c0_g1_i2.p1 TRINITY_DN39541_c0_g1~~TRINITY_DN39541_c0_g1_i2.p1  ORF type:complete len:215 (-),score=40.61 TRINITY_DN39541_c0_g1_i2:200-844(-)
MIYIFKGCEGCCNGFGKACDRLCHGCNHVCRPCCQVLERPLGGFVLLAAILGLPATLFGALAVTEPEASDCEQPLLMVCGVNAVLGLLHPGMALYLQVRLLSGLDPAQLTSADLSAKELLNRAWHIVLYDVCFCFYIFAFFGGFFFNLWSFGAVSGCQSTYIWLSSTLLLLFGLGALGFTFLWFLVMACEDCCNFGGSSRPKSQPSGGPWLHGQ